jgi:hypothetical protein
MRSRFSFFHISFPFKNEKSRAQSGRRVDCSTLADLSPRSNEPGDRVQARLNVLTHPALLVVDEIGLPADQPHRPPCSSFSR